MNLYKVSVRVDTIAVRTLVRYVERYVSSESVCNAAAQALDYVKTTTNTSANYFTVENIQLTQEGFV